MNLENPRERIAIAGAGVAGAYLYRLLRNHGVDAEVFDVPHRTRCGLSPCAWGTTKDFNKLVELTGLRPEKYILQSFDHLVVDEMRVKAEIMTIDKPALINDLLAGARIKSSAQELKDYGRIIDATGVSRVFLPKILDDIILTCSQRLIETADRLDIGIKTLGAGYAWCFPLSSQTYHIGFGDIHPELGTALKERGWFCDDSENHRKVVCGCKAQIRLTGPHNSQPFVSLSPFGRVWGIGEAIGCVAPLTGEGIVPAMKSCLILLHHWSDSDGFIGAILKEFNWMRGEYEILDKLLHKKRLGNGDTRALWMAARRKGVKINIKQASELMHRLT